MWYNHTCTFFYPRIVYEKVNIEIEIIFSPMENSAINLSLSVHTIHRNLKGNQ